MSNGIRAVRNNNPGNIERGAPWQGLMPRDEMTDAQKKETRFCVFQSPKWGFRAMAITLITYYDKRKAKDGSRIDTIKEVIHRWAPPSENKTDAYIKAVDKAHPATASETIDLHEHADLAPLVKAIAIHECGGWFFDQKDLEAGLRLAGVEEPPGKLVKSRTVTAATVGGAATGVSLLAEVVEQVTPATSLISNIAEYAPAVAGVLVLGILGAIIWYRYDDWKRAKR